jgi:hypothetical protein
VGAIHKDLFPKAIQGYSSQFQPIQPFLARPGDIIQHGAWRPFASQTRVAPSQSKSKQVAASPTFLRNNILLFFITMLCNVQQSRQRMECGASAPPIGAVCPNLHFTCLP